MTNTHKVKNKWQRDRLADALQSSTYYESESFRDVLNKLRLWIDDQYCRLSGGIMLIPYPDGNDVVFNKESGILSLHFTRPGRGMSFNWAHYLFEISIENPGHIVVLNSADVLPRAYPLMDLGPFTDAEDSMEWLKNNPNFYKWSKFINKTKGGSDER